MHREELTEPAIGAVVGILPPGARPSPAELTLSGTAGLFSPLPSHWGDSESCAESHCLG